MGAAPEGPGDDEGGFDLALRQARSNTADFLYRPADQPRLLRIIVRLLFGGAGILALVRMAASMGLSQTSGVDGSLDLRPSLSLRRRGATYDPECDCRAAEAPLEGRLQGPAL